METLKISVEGFDFDEVASELKRLTETQDINVQVKPASVDFGGLALDPATIIVSGASVLSALITALFAYLATRRQGDKALSSLLVQTGGRLKSQKAHRKMILGTLSNRLENWTPSK